MGKKVNLLSAVILMSYDALIFVLKQLPEILKHSNSSQSSKEALYCVGEVLSGTRDGKPVINEFGLISDLFHCDAETLRECHKTVELYRFWCDSARDTCVSWVLIAKQIGLNKDVRRMIAKMLWDARKECLFDAETGN